MKCVSCNNEFSDNELDLDGFCYICSNPDVAEIANAITANLKELLENTVVGLAAAKGVSPGKLKADLVAEHVLNNPEKYIKHAVASVVSKKNKDIKNN